METSRTRVRVLGAWLLGREYHVCWVGELAVQLRLAEGGVHDASLRLQLRIRELLFLVTLRGRDRRSTRIRQSRDCLAPRPAS